MKEEEEKEEDEDEDDDDDKDEEDAQDINLLTDAQKAAGTLIVATGALGTVASGFVPGSRSCAFRGRVAAQ